MHFNGAFHIACGRFAGVCREVHAISGHGLQRHSAPWPMLPLHLVRAPAHRAARASVQILHLDIKSSNVLLTKTLNAKVSDVGIAKAMQSGEGIALTQARRSPHACLRLIDCACLSGVCETTQ